jgi:hypothetical protein
MVKIAFRAASLISTGGAGGAAGVFIFACFSGTFTGFLIFLLLSWEVSVLAGFAGVIFVFAVNNRFVFALIFFSQTLGQPSGPLLPENGDQAHSGMVNIRYV